MKNKKSKPTKLFYGNQYRGSFHVGEGKLQRIWRMTKLYTSFFLVAGFVAALLFMAFAPKPAEAEPTVVERLVTIYEESAGVDVTELQDEVLAELGVGCETLGTSEPEGVIILDSNNEFSIGEYQWQIESVQRYHKELYGEEITRAEAITIAVNHERATKLTRDVLFGGKVEAEEAMGNWYNCAKKLSLATKVDWINKLNK